jgi:hypothetical protein
MSYRSENIATVVKRLNVQYFLPGIQREFVWSPEQIIQLFDSIMRGYPISSFLFWELQPENRDNWQAYRFLDKASYGGAHNEAASTAGVQQLTLILDGQQRLTSLLIGLRGTYVMKKKYKRWDSPDAWIKQKLYVDLFKDPNGHEDGGGDAGIYYGFAFLEKAPPPNTEHHWFPVGHILDFDSEKAFDDFRDDSEEKLSGELKIRQKTVFRKNLERIYRAVWKDEVIAYYTEVDQDYDRVLDIFIRANEGGTKLSKSDLLLSMITSNWDGVNARDEIYGFVERINDSLTRKNYFDKDFVMKSCLVLSDLPVAYKVGNFNNKNLLLIQRNWDGIKSAVERAVDLTNFFGIDRDNLTSANALIPIIYYFYQRPAMTLRGSTPFDARNAGAIRKWLAMALLNGVLGGSSDSMLRDIRAVLQRRPSKQDDFPVVEINIAIEQAGRKAAFDSVAIENILSLTYGKQVSFLALTLLYDELGWGTMSFHKDHIFPQALFRWKHLEDIGKTEWYYTKDRLANLALLLSHENVGKSDESFDKWIQTRDKEFVKRHLIPSAPSLWKEGRFADFMQEREKLIRARLETLFGGPGATA